MDFSITKLQSMGSFQAKCLKSIVKERYNFFWNIKTSILLCWIQRYYFWRIFVHFVFIKKRRKYSIIHNSEVIITFETPVIFSPISFSQQYWVGKNKSHSSVGHQLQKKQTNSFFFLLHDALMQKTCFSFDVAKDVFLLSSPRH